MGKKVLCLIFAFLLSINSFAAVVADNDGSAFITKAEFDNLKNNFQSQLDSYNTNIDAKIDSAIAGYLAGINVESEKNIDSLLNKLSSTRRTFLSTIANPTTSKQENLYISTNGVWLIFRPMAEQDGPEYWSGYELSGINNYQPPHIKTTRELNNLTSGDRKGNGKYVFVDPVTDVTTEDEYYITDEYLKDLKYIIWSVGGKTTYYDGGNKQITVQPNAKDSPAISWSATYNWTGTNERTVAKQNRTGTFQDEKITAAETLYLDIKNYDFDTTKSGINPIPWINYVSGGQIFESTEMGCLKSKDQYYWSHRVTNFSLGTSGPQSYGARYDSSGNVVESINSHLESNKIPLSFNVPKITGVKGTKIVLKDVSTISGVRSYYYSGLPLCVVEKEGELKVEIRITLNGTGATNFTLALAKEPFSNIEINNEAESKILYRTSKSITDSDINSNILKFTIEKDKFKGFKNNTVWIKAKATNGTDSSITIESSSIKIKYDN